MRVSDREGPDRGDSVTRAIFAFRRNLVVAASAGTGKTYALVGVAVHLLVGACQAEGGGLRPPILPDALVATTFSRKAAAEIRARLTGELEKLASGDSAATYRAALLAAGPAAGTASFTDAELADRAAAALGHIGRAKIGTLHRFAGSLVRAHALALGLPPDFDLVDEVVTKERAVVAIERVLETQARAKDLAPVIEMAGGVVAFIDLVQSLLAKIADDGREASSLVLPEGDAALVDRSFHRLLEHATDLVLDPRLGAAACRVLETYRAGAREGLTDAVAQLCGISAAGKHSPAAEAFFAFRSALGSPRETLRERGRRFTQRWRARDEIAPRGRAVRSLLAACAAEIARDNARDAVLGFAAVLRAARDLLRDHLPVAALAGAALGALLVDELQDTSGVQRDLVHLLWERHGDGQVRLPGTIPRAGELRPAGLLVVGDRKQSIYAFRGADAAVFAELCVGLAGAPVREALAIPRGIVWEPARPTADFLSLRHNRRGETELLQFANAWSRLALVPEARPAALYEVDYAPATEDLLPPRPARAAVDLPRTRWLRPVVSSGQRASTKLREAEVMAARIGCIVRGEELSVRGVPARWRDVAILAETHEALAAAAYALAKADIPHVVAGMGFYGAREVRDVVAMLACLVDPDDTLALVEVLRGPWAGASDRSLVALTDRHVGVVDVTGWTVGERRHLMPPDERPAILALAGVVRSLRPIIGRIGPGLALREAARVLQLEETLVLLPRGEQRVANVRKVLAMADDATDPLTLLQRLRAAAAAEQREGEAATFSEEDDAVRLLTVHACKGLAFPIVFLPGAGAARRPPRMESIAVQSGVAGKPSTLVMRVLDDTGTVQDTPTFTEAKVDLRRREAAEQQRLRYVAITRASVAMFFVGDRSTPKNASESYERSTAGVLARLAADEGSSAAAQILVETGSSLDRSVAREVPLFAES